MPFCVGHQPKAVVIPLALVGGNGSGRLGESQKYSMSIKCHYSETSVFRFLESQAVTEVYRVKGQILSILLT